MSGELYKLFRPKTLDEVYGQGDEINKLKGLLKDKKKFPHTLLLSGPSGTGKTTIARILRRELECHKNDYQELNVAQSRGIDTIRDITDKMHLSPMYGPCKVYYLDEVHGLTGAAQEASLKILEDTPNHVYFFLATTEPEKLKPTIITRSTEVKLKSLGVECMRLLINGVVKKAGGDVSEDVCDRIIEVAEGSARQALKVLHQVLSLKGDDSRLAAIEDSSNQKKGVSLAKLLASPTKFGWKEVVQALKELPEADIESTRRGILGYAAAGLTNGFGNPNRWLMLIDTFQKPFFDCGKAGFTAGCYLAFHQK